MNEKELTDFANKLDKLLREYQFEHMEEFVYRRGKTDIKVEIINHTDNL